ncbi:MAG TPA: cytochrome c-type biogenesis protein CcmH [Acidimicrobiales bacterium]|nr:cytochrome c-type biogenesis protein CcmH [Acidimicrobiales bacterium]
MTRLGGAVRSFTLYALALVAVATLAVTLAPRAAGSAARVARLESLVRCPSCADLSVAQSDATSAIAVRHEIAADVARGLSDTEILTSLEAAYGTSILLSPPTSGLGALLWIGPLLVGLAVVAGAIRVARRR